jgi:TolB-like protein/DNA-binding winged helix-turn-helix (wHTH) protein
MNYAEERRMTVSMATADDAQTAGSGELRVGEWVVDSDHNELRRGAERVRLEPKVIEVLVHLARHAGHVVGREELLAAVWPGVIVGDDALTQAIIKLRKALGDDAHKPTYIETISKRGYRLIAPVSQSNPTAAPAIEKRSRWGRKRILPIVAAGIVAVAIGAVLVFPEIARVVGMPWPIALDKTGVSTGGHPTIAVLPLSNLSGDAKRDYFSDGITEDIINALGRYSGVRVIARSSVDAYKDRAATPQVIARELGARYIVRGSVRQADAKLRVAVELSDAQKGVLLWSDRFEGEGKDVFEIQDRIVKNVVGALTLKVTRLEQERSASKSPASLEAYDLVLHARALVTSSNRASNRQARELLAKAVQLAPNFAEAYVVWSNAETQRSIYGWMENPDEGLRHAEELARRALTIDDVGAQARAHGQLGAIYTATGRFSEALPEADRALELNPSDIVAIELRGATLLWLGRTDEAIATLETAMRFDPAGRSSSSGLFLALAYYLAQRYRDSFAVAQAANRRYPDHAFLHAVRAAALAQLGERDEAGKAVAATLRLDPFFKVEQFGTRFVEARHTAHVQEGLRKAGF